MKNIKIFIDENFNFTVIKFSIYLNRRVFVMDCILISFVIIESILDTLKIKYRLSRC